jgi:hypothetical protein
MHQGKAPASLLDPMKTVALIPARSGSKRVKAKNIRVLNGHPLLAYTLNAAQSSGVFDAVVVSTDSEVVAEVARHYGGEVPFLRPAAFAGDLSPDIEWVRCTLKTLAEQGRTYESFAFYGRPARFERPVPFSGHGAFFTSFRRPIPFGPWSCADNIPEKCGSGKGNG